MAMVLLTCLVLLPPSMTAAATNNASPSVGMFRVANIQALSARDIHAIAWPAARRYYNETIAAPRGERPLGADAYAKPTAIYDRGDFWRVIYADKKSGPAIMVELSKNGEILNIVATHPKK